MYITERIGNNTHFTQKLAWIYVCPQTDKKTKNK